MSLITRNARRSVTFRIGRRPDCWTLPSAERSGAGRFDDPSKCFRVLYLSGQRLGCYLETLACFRPSLQVMADLKLIAEDDDHFPLGKVPQEWLDSRLLGKATVTGKFLDVAASESISSLRIELADLWRSHGLEEFDLSQLTQSVNRGITQGISQFAMASGFHGVYYRSRFGVDILNWAAFEPVRLRRLVDKPVHRDDPDFVRACQIHGLTS